jgi:hypothetical protein
MEIKYKRQHNESFMVLEGSDVIRNYEERMIEENDICSLLKFNKLNVNGIQQYNYNISRKENLEDFLEAQRLDLDMFRRLLLNIKIAYEEIGRYLIDERHIFLSKETIFLEKNNESFKVSLCYYPKDMGGVQQQFRELMEYFLKLVTPENRHLTEKIYNAYDLCLKEDFTLSEIIESLQQDQEEEISVQRIVLDDMDDSIEEDYPEFVPQGEYLSELYEETDKRDRFQIGHLWDSVKGLLSSRIPYKDTYKEEMEDFEIDPDYEIEERTILLSHAKPAGKLVYDGPNHEEDFLIDKDIFRIGSGKNNDAVINEKTVSSNHAKIVREGDDYYISDLNSTNSTYVNNRELTYKSKIRLSVMDKISFANVSYVFM